MCGGSVLLESSAAWRSLAWSKGAWVALFITSRSPSGKAVLHARLSFRLSAVQSPGVGCTE